MTLFQNVIQSARTPLQVVSVAIRQTRNHKVWGTKRSPKTSKDVALDYFDSVYGTLYGKKWPSIRLALLCPNKYCAVLNNFTDTQTISTELQNEGAINIRDMFEVQKQLLLEKNQSKKKKKKPNQPDAVQKKLEIIATGQRDAELGRIYPVGAERINEETFGMKNSKEGEEISNKEELIKQAKSPLEQGILDAKIDWNRQIDPNEGLSSSRLNDYVPVSQLKGKENFISESEHFSFCNDPSDFPITIEPEDTLNFPPHLQIYTFDPGNISRFQPSRPGSNGLSSYYIMDAGSILPVLTLDLRPGDSVLDMCAAPGGKSYLCLQTLYPDSLLCNDISVSRLNRLRYVMQQYISNWEDKVTIHNSTREIIQEAGTFSKILVDVPCTNDRLSVNVDDNNIFTSSRNRERILLPEQQVQLLFEALKMVTVGGSVVYSTCSLNPAQNDGVVQMALRRVWQETSMKIVVKDLSNALQPAKIVFKFAEPNFLRYGSLVVPYLPSNFGPMYFCKLQRVE